MVAAIEVSAISKRFGQVQAVDGVDLTVAPGTVYGLLGPNGAGKTTVVRILTTIIAPDEGSAKILGLDVVTQAQRVRANIGLAGQYAAVDEQLTGRENLELVGRLTHQSRSTVGQRCGELLERFNLVDAADRTLKTYSGGMRRRLEEADQLASRIAVIDRGTVIAEGTARELKSQMGATVLEVSFGDTGAAHDALAVIDGIAPGAEVDGAVVRAPVDDGAHTAIVVLRALDQAEVAVSGLTVREPSLDDVFLRLTGHRAEVS